MACIPERQRALKIVEAGKVEVVEGAQVPHAEGDEVLIRVVSVAVNPADAKSLDLSPTRGATVGVDFAGEVVKVGPAVRKQISVGDRVCGPVFGNNPLRPENGAFAEYVAAPGDLLFKIPEAMDFDQACTLGVSLATVGLALYQSLGIPMPTSFSTVQRQQQQQQQRYVLIYGGGTATGTMAIQMAARSGLVPITTCSPERFDWVKSLGAAAAFDYRSPSVGSDIRAFTRNTLNMALDCITTTTTMSTCYEAISSNGGKYLSLDPFPIRTHTRRSVRPSWVFGLTIFGKPVMWKRPMNVEAKPSDKTFTEKWFLVAQSMLDKGDIRTHKYETRVGGLAGLVGGLDDVRKGQVAGKKLVYRVQECLPLADV
ncbi:putative alcohol dehydrogenase [Chaetomium fimeti]|uniref:Alcohol dehydrogenase n=1 Tax=Chaetomium fimeti TaxID=1854472 RepID=A0AAE0HKV3_9PEZI|nr:putative alcohol dehydrogenase [Chaetomium fimeti]